MQTLLWDLSHGWTLRYHKPTRHSLPGWDRFRGTETSIVPGAAARWLLANGLIERVPDSNEYRLTEAGHWSNLSGEL
jgi:hypothetical protein